MKKSTVVLLHLGYWLLYLLLVSSFFLVLPNGSREISANGWARVLFFSPVSIRFILPGLLGFYSFYLFLFPRFLNRKKLIAFFVSAIAVSVICAIIVVLLSYSLFNSNSVNSLAWTEKIAMVLLMAFLILIHGIIGLVMRGFISWYSDIALKTELNRKNYETELALVKSQINPHFLFNTIHNIDVLIEKDAEKASLYLNKLSDIMRFMLYETKNEEIPLAKELLYIEKYIELQKIRSNNPDFVNYTITGHPDKWAIAPMLLISFIENAFKYAENKKTGRSITIAIKITNEQLNFSCENFFDRNHQATDGGLGNELIGKRLTLLYPQRHQLKTDSNNSIYKVNLCITS